MPLRGPAAEREPATPVVCSHPLGVDRRERRQCSESMATAPPSPAASNPHRAAGPAQRRAPELGGGASDETQLSGAEAQLALCEPDHLRRLEQPLKYGFADRSSARKGLEVAAGVAIADRLGLDPPDRRPPDRPPRLHGDRLARLALAAARAHRRLGGALHPVPAPARLRLGGVGQERPPGAQAHPPQPAGGALGGRGQRFADGQEDPRGPLRDHRPGAVAGGERRPPGAPRLHLPRQLVPRAAAA